MLFIISGYFLYVPPENVDVWYFTGWLLVFYFAWTLFEIPHLAWPSELAHTSESKARIYSFRTMASYAGWILFYIVPLLPIFESHAITPDTLKFLVIIVGVLAVPFFALCLKTQFPVRHSPTLSLAVHTKSQQAFYDFVQSLISNKPLLLFIAAYLLKALSTGLWYSLIFLYVDVYLGMGEYYAQTFLYAFVIGLASTPLWYKLAVWWGKKRTWAVGTLLLIISFFFTGLLSPGDTTFTQLVILKTVQTLGLVCMTAMVPAMLSEIIDYSNWKNRDEKSATYFAIYNFLTKTTVAIAMALGLAIAGWYGFDATTSSPSEQGIFGITLAIAWLPPVFAILSLLFIFLSPINERRHHIIRSRLDSLAKRREKRQVVSEEASGTASLASPSHESATHNSI